MVHDGVLDASLPSEACRRGSEEREGAGADTGDAAGLSCQTKAEGASQCIPSGSPALRMLGEKLLRFGEEAAPTPSTATPPASLPPPSDASEADDAEGPEATTWTGAVVSLLWRISSRWSSSFDDIDTEQS